MAKTTTLTTTAPIAEDVRDVIYDISPTDTPFLSTIKKEKITGQLHEWQTDELAAANSANAHKQGSVAPPAVASTPVRLNNRTQIFYQTASVSRSMEVVKKYGMKGGLKYEMLKKGKEQKRDIEAALLSNRAKRVEDGANASLLAGVLTYLADNTSAGVGGVDPTGDGSDIRTDGVQRPFSENLLKPVIASCWDNGGEPDVIMVGSFNKQQASTFAGLATKYNVAKEKITYAVADIYVSDFGTLNIVPNRFMRTRDALVLQMDTMAFGTLPESDMRVEPLAKTGDFDSEQVITEGTLIVMSPKASGGVFDLTTA